MGVVTLTVVENEPEADVIVGLLQTNGIKSFHRSTNLSSSAYAAASPTEVSSTRPTSPGHSRFSRPGDLDGRRVLELGA